MSKLSKNILYNLAGQFTLLLLSFVATRQIYRQIGDDALGIIYFSFALQTVIYRAMLSGITSTIVREVAHNLSTDLAYIRNLIRSASLLYWGLYALSTVTILVSAPWITSRWLTLSTLDPLLATQGIQILLIGVLFGLPISLYSGILIGIQDMAFTNIVDVATAGLRQFGLLAILFYWGDSFLAICYWITIINSLPLLAYLYRLLQSYSPRTLFVPAWSTDVFRRTQHMAPSMMLISLLTVVQAQADKFLITLFMPVRFLSYYTFTFNYLSKTSSIRSAITTAAMPALSALHAKGDLVRLRLQFLRLLELQSFGLVPLFGFVGFAQMPVLTYIFDANIARLMVIPGILLTISFYLNGVTGPVQFLAVSTGQPQVPARSNLYSVFISVPLSVWMISSYGLSGAGVALIVQRMMLIFHMGPRVYQECLNDSASLWFVHLGQVLLLILCTYGIAGLSFFWIAPTLIHLGIVYTLATIVYVIGAYFLVDDSLIKLAQRTATRLLFQKA